MRSPILIASSMSCVTKTTVFLTVAAGAGIVLQARAVDRVDGAERLVHQHQRRVRGECPRDADALALSARELRWVAAGHLLGVEPDQRSSSCHARCDARPRPAEQMRHRRDVLGDRLWGNSPICWIT